MSRMLHVDRQRPEVAQPLPAGDLDGAMAQDELAHLKELLDLNARQMAELRRRNEQLMAVNSDLRCKLGEMTLRWVDLCNRTGV